MDALYRLVFQGEVAANQHVAVVRKRLAKLLKANESTLDTLFSGKPVVLRKSVDAAAAAKFQQAFEQAGAKLRVQPLAGTAPAAEKIAAAAASGEKAAPDDAASSQEQSPEQKAGEWPLLPVGSNVLEEHERPVVVDRQVAVDHLSLAEPGEQLGPVLEGMADADALLAAAADFSLAEVGAQLVDGNADQDLERVEVPELPLAEVGTPMLSAAELPPEPAAVAAPEFSLADPGTRLTTSAAADASEPPDTSHLKLVADSEDD